MLEDVHEPVNPCWVRPEVAAELGVTAAVPQLAFETGEGDHRGVLPETLPAVGDARSRVDEQMEFGPYELEVVVEPGDRDKSRIFWSQGERQQLRQALAKDLMR